MTATRTHLFGFTFCAVFILALSVFVDLRPTNGFSADTNQARPFLAIWRDNDGFMGNSQAPSLRVAIWNDGTIIFAQDTNKWSHQLRRGQIDSAALAELKKAITATGVFKLKGNCYLVPDAPVDCTMIDLGDKQQMLYWDEVEAPGYGINFSPKAHHLEFKKSWKEVNKLALAAIPKVSEPFNEPFRRPPKSWRLKEPLQSE